MGIKGTGQEFELGIIPASAWHTAIALAANSKLKVTSAPTLRLMQEIIQDETMGEEFANRLDRGRIMQDFNFEAPLRYESALWTHIIQLLGTDTVTGEGPYIHTVAFDREIDGVFYTAAGCIRDTATAASSEIFEWPSVKPISFEITIGGDGFMTVKCTGIADTFLDTGATGIVNTTTTIVTTSTYKAENLLVPFGHCSVWLEDYSGAALDVNDAIKPNSITISVTRPIVRDFLADRVAGDAGGDANAFKTSEPRQDGRPFEIFLTVELPQTVNNDYIEDMRSDTAKLGQVLFEYSSNYSAKFQFPHLRYYDFGIEPGGLARIPQTITFQCLEAQHNSSGVATAPTAMSGVTDPITLTLTNQTSTSYVTGS